MLVLELNTKTSGVYLRYKISDYCLYKLIKLSVPDLIDTIFWVIDGKAWKYFHYSDNKMIYIAVVT